MNRLDDSGHRGGIWFEVGAGRVGYPDSPDLTIRARLNDAVVMLHAVDDMGAGTKDLYRLLAAMPAVLTQARTEIGIQKEAAGLDEELKELLEDD